MLVVDRSYKSAVTVEHALPVIKIIQPFPFKPVIIFDLHDFVPSRNNRSQCVFFRAGRRRIQYV